MEDGSGLKASPVAPENSQCLILKCGNNHYIMGFLSPHGIVAHGDIKPVRAVNPGDVLITHSTPSKVGILAEGSIVMEAGKWASMVINPVTQQITSWFRNFRHNFFSMVIDYFAREDSKKATLTMKLAKWVPSLGLPLLPPDGSSPVTPDHFTLRAGSLDDDHIIELLISQKYLGTVPSHTSTTQIGRQQDGTFLAHDVHTGPSGNTNDFSLRAKDDGSLAFQLSNSSGHPFTKITIDPQGNVTIKTEVGQSIKLGGTGNEQQLVTKAFIDQYYMHHTHLNGNQGAPTGPPMNPITPLSQDSSTGPVTFTTLAE